MTRKERRTLDRKELDRRVSDTIREIAGLIQRWESAAGLYKRAYGLVGKWIPGRRWEDWDALSGRFEAGWSGLMHARSLFGGLRDRQRELLELNRTRRDLDREPAFQTGMVLVLALCNIIGDRVEAMSEAAKRARDEAEVSGDAECDGAEVATTAEGM